MPVDMPAPVVVTVPGVGTVAMCKQPTLAPTLIYVSSNARDSMVSSMIPTLWFAASRTVVSLDLPGHGDDIRPVGETSDGLANWAIRARNGEDIVQDFCSRLSKLIDLYLIPNGISAAGRIAIGGHSRGGFMAMHALARVPSIKAGSALIPVTRLSALTEFNGVNSWVVDATEIKHELLERKPLFVSMDMNDSRVSTGTCADNMAAIIARAGALNAMELHIAPAADHAFPDGAEARAAAVLQAAVA